MAEKVYNRAKDDIMEAWLAGKTLKCLLLKTTAAGAFDPDIDTVTQLLAVGSVAEADFTNYARKTLASLTATEDDTNDRDNVDAANITWTAAGGVSNNTPCALVVYDATTDTNDGTRRLVSYHDTGFTVATNGGDYVVAIPDFLRAT